MRKVAVWNGKEFDMNVDGAARIGCMGLCLFPSELEALGFTIREVPDEEWRPKVGDEFHWLSAHLRAYTGKFSGTELQNKLVDGGNCFPTREAAEARIPAVREAYRGGGVDFRALLKGFDVHSFVGGMNWSDNWAKNLYVPAIVAGVEKCLAAILAKAEGK
jgi:hypothetical protein